MVINCNEGKRELVDKKVEINFLILYAILMYIGQTFRLIIRILFNDNGNVG